MKYKTDAYTDIGVKKKTNQDALRLNYKKSTNKEWYKSLLGMYL